MELKLYVSEDNGMVGYVASEPYLKSENIDIDKALKDNPTLKEHKIVIRIFTGLMDREVNNQSSGNKSRWSDLVCEKAIVSWTIDREVFEGGESLGRQIFSVGNGTTENSLLEMPILLANAVRALVTDAVYLPVRNPFQKP